MKRSHEPNETADQELGEPEAAKLHQKILIKAEQKDPSSEDNEKELNKIETRKKLMTYQETKKPQEIYK